MMQRQYDDEEDEAAGRDHADWSGQTPKKLSAAEIARLEVGEYLVLKYFDMSAKTPEGMLRSGVWKTAKVVKNNTRRHPNKVKVAFEGLSSKHSCWIDHHDAKRFGGLASKV